MTKIFGAFKLRNLVRLSVLEEIRAIDIIYQGSNDQDDKYQGQDPQE